jgi:UPF0755 protein
MGRVLKILAVLVIAAAAFAGGAAYWGHRLYTVPGPSRVGVTVVIERGVGTDAIARALFRAGVIADPLVFRLAARLQSAKRPLQAGEYAFPAGVSAKGALELMQSGKTVVRRLTVAEGLTWAEVKALLERAEGLMGRVESRPAEGMLLPETYHYSWGDRREQVLRRMQDAMSGMLANLWPGRSPGLPLLSPTEALILASIVEKETAIPAERPRIAAVFLNRLKRNMRLQSDPTVVYGLTGGNGMLGRVLTRTDLKTPTPYNTYLIDGLPPGPIANPGSASLEAVLRPAATDDLYFVADGSGGHVFARTLEEHNRNVARWRKVNQPPGDAKR